ncbi:hypothetical protein L6R52_28560 [Myxococcota bacterium]|nr:hypothetical protein [Myxococcota bacterium]
MIVFTGPTLSPTDAGVELDASYRPPAACGDVYRAALEGPWGIGIIDGYFEHRPSVWHKEILWAMSRGVHVFGAASMGALRAAELAPFGMEGVGEVFRALRDGTLEDDDEVAIVHAAAEDGFPALSDAMVNLRATLAAAREAGVIDAPTHDALVGLAKQTHYPERSYPGLLRTGAERGIAPDVLAALSRFLPQGRVDQKRADALAMLRLMRERFATHPGPKRVRFSFEHTDAWESFVRDMGAAARAGQAPPHSSDA